MQQPAGDKQHADRIDQPARRLLQLGKQHQDEGDRHIFGEISMRSHPPQELAIAAIAERHLGLAPLHCDAHAEEHEEQGK